ncbi:uncharacterized protein LOC110874709 [Helianthus annuus]|uniref:uncharacterized protein LOC110874709 n=1 Tax=Helianthus annuus TaxID=4232 RepID=UPI000B8EEB17|nr:uncharacterized protein LOC110874709 [Helianthus annuus]
MFNPITSVFRGVGHVVGSIFGGSIDFLAGKSCNSVCGPTWDVACYIEHFCIEHLLKFFCVSFLLYMVLLLLYFLYKLKIFHCFFKTSFKMVGAVLSTIFACWEYGCSVLCGMLMAVHEKRKMYKRDIELANMNSISYEEDQDEDSDSDSNEEASFSYHREHYRRRRRSWSGDNRNDSFRRSLKARSHRVHVGVDSARSTKRKHIKDDDVRVIRTSSFARKGPSHKRSRHHRKTRSM